MSGKKDFKKNLTLRREAIFKRFEEYRKNIPKSGDFDKILTQQEFISEMLDMYDARKPFTKLTSALRYWVHPMWEEALHREDILNELLMLMDYSLGAGGEIYDALESIPNLMMTLKRAPKARAYAKERINEAIIEITNYGYGEGRL